MEDGVTNVLYLVMFVLCAVMLGILFWATFGPRA